MVNYMEEFIGTSMGTPILKPTFFITHKSNKDLWTDCSIYASISHPLFLEEIPLSPLET